MFFDQNLCMSCSILINSLGFNLLDIFHNLLWKERQVYFTKIATPHDVGDKLPINPNDKEG